MGLSSTRRRATSATDVAGLIIEIASFDDWKASQQRFALHLRQPVDAGLLNQLVRNAGRGDRGVTQQLRRLKGHTDFVERNNVGL